MAIDIDSTLHPYWDQLAEIAQRRYGVELPYADQLTWAIHQLTPEQLKAVVEETHSPERVLGAEPYPGAVEAIARWHEAGHYIHITSHRAAVTHPQTAEWLEQIGLPHDDLYCSNDKLTRCMELEIDVLIDDAPETLQRAVALGITAATLEHPWNRGVADVISAPDWPTLATKLEPHLQP